MDLLEKALFKARKQQDSRQHDEIQVPVESRVGNPEFAVLETVDGQTVEKQVAEHRLTETRVQPVPQSVLEHNRLVAAAPNNSIADRYRSLRAQVFRRLSATGARTLGICSSTAGAGKSLTAANLAISMALDPKYTVLLVDFDLRRPTLHKYFGLGTVPGLVDFLGEEATIEECLVAPQLGNLVLLPAGRPVRNSSEMLASLKVTKLMKELASRYLDRIVIFDLPPLLSGDDALVTLENIQATLLVVREGETAAGELQASLSLLEGHQLLGTVLNCADERNLYPYY